MARKNKRVTIETGRDKGKEFSITEMPVLKADRWAMRAIFSLTKAGVNIEGLDPKNGMMEMATQVMQKQKILVSSSQRSLAH